MTISPNPIGEAVQHMDPPRFLVGEAAVLIGRSVDTLERWRDEGLLMPSDSRTFGSLTVYLYTRDDIAKGREIAKHRRPGRKTYEQLELELSWASDTPKKQPIPKERSGD